MRVSVCITTHNDADVLPRAITSVLDQTHRPLELLIVDDGSDTPPPHWADDRGVPMRWFHITNRGLPAARNVGLMNARGEAFLPLDADDWLDTRYIEKTVPLLAAGADVVLTGIQEHGPTRNGEYLPGFDMPWHLVSEEALWKTNRYYYASLCRTALLREVGGYHTHMAGAWGKDGGFEDWDLWLDLTRRRAKFDAVLEPLFHYDTSKPNSMLARAMRNREALVAEMRRHHRVD